MPATARKSAEKQGEVKVDRVLKVSNLSHANGVVWTKLAGRITERTGVRMSAINVLDLLIEQQRPAGQCAARISRRDCDVVAELRAMLSEQAKPAKADNASQ